MNSKFWFEDPSVLFNRNNYMLFFPTSYMNHHQKLNSLIRLSVYISIVMFLYSMNYLYLFIPIVTMILTFLMFKSSNYRLKSKETFCEDKNYINPTKDNPFMNILMNEYIDNPCRDTILNNEQSNNNEIIKNVNDKFNINLYKDLSDVYDKMNSQRQYYTTPITTIPNKQKDFADWCFRTNKTCKENNGSQCVKNNYYPLHNNKIFI